MEIQVRVALALMATPGIGRRDWRVLAGAHPGDLARDIASGREALSARVRHPVGATDPTRVDRQLERAAKAGALAVTLWDDTYPPMLRAIDDAPPLLFVRGDASLLASASVAIVGTRAPSSRGTALARRLGRSLAGMGIVVVSGLARGIDTAAHRGALDAVGPTVAVLGTGIDVVYPPENGALMETIASRGCVISEQMCGTPGTAHVFPRRNRIISGLSEAVVVVEGGARSGALITARWALDQGREVGAVPGFPGDFRSKGPNQLLRDGAFVVEDAVDVLASVPRLRGYRLEAPAPDDARAAPDVDADERRVLALVTGEADADEVAAAAGIPVARVLEILARLEIEGHIARDAGGRFARVSQRG